MAIGERRMAAATDFRTRQVWAYSQRADGTHRRLVGGPRLRSGPESIRSGLNLGHATDADVSVACVNRCSLPNFWSSRADRTYPAPRPASSHTQDEPPTPYPLSPSSYPLCHAMRPPPPPSVPATTAPISSGHRPSPPTRRPAASNRPATSRYSPSRLSFLRCSLTI